MKDFGEFEDRIFDSYETVKKITRRMAGNMSKIIAAVAAAVMTAVTFTDIRFECIFSESFFGSLLLLLTTAYVIYFSLEDAGEDAGAECSEYIAAMERYRCLRDKIRGEHLEPLCIFCEEYSIRESESRKRNLLIGSGLSPDMLLRYQSGERFDKRTERILKRAERIKKEPLSPRILLSSSGAIGRSEIESPEKRKLQRLILKLIPSTVCMSITVSVILSAKDGMTPSDILNGILKLSALPVIGFRGFCAGYSYSKHSLALWLETKAGILEAFLGKYYDSNASALPNTDASD